MAKVLTTVFLVLVPIFAALSPAPTRVVASAPPSATRDPAMGLPWHESLDSAIDEAQATGKPILSLRMLGRLDEELSCANSRFFRTALYSNEQLRAEMTDGFVLHWKSVRPVPVLTIDYGDGRRIVRTVTGNSVHLVLDERGRAVDAIPGLVGPEAFRRTLQSGARIARETAGLADIPRSEALVRHHESELEELRRVQADDIARGGLVEAGESPVADAAFLESAVERFRYGSAREWMGRTADRTGSGWATRRGWLSGLRSGKKRRTEMDMRAFSIPDAGSVLSSPVWERLATLHADDARLDEASREELARVHATNPVVQAHGNRSNLLRDTVRGFEAALALDTILSERLLHPVVRQWLIEEPAQLADPEALTARIYDDLFATAHDDRWLGLAEPDAYLAIDYEAIVTE